MEDNNFPRPDSMQGSMQSGMSDGGYPSMISPYMGYPCGCCPYGAYPGGGFPGGGYPGGGYPGREDDSRQFFFGGRPRPFFFPFFRPFFFPFFFPFFGFHHFI